ncbi:gamma-glutamyltransferase [Lignipirellula cremea]|uniref:Glutathione hydrolase proenzyme n=1 Tax=Lignipirellula cremea TaxID=2528010 RepID=A0A518DR84_9BACT|nr:gamma-glutamyltransferase [Lignipirellula cremea]QDU94339.1 Gamma-glutamyltranspeptidase precursor [Lignipirellula cremea]
MMVRCVALLILSLTVCQDLRAEAFAERSRRGMVVAQEVIAAKVGRDTLQAGGNAIDAAVATAFALAVTHPEAGNLGGGGFLLYRPAEGKPVAYDFRETAPALATADMWRVDGKYDPVRHHYSHLAVGVPGTVAGLHRAWKEHGSLPWEQLLAPAVALAADGFLVSEGLAQGLRQAMPRFLVYPASLRAFTRNGKPYQAGDRWRQPDLAQTLQRIAAEGPKGFYQGKTAELIAAEMQRGGGILTQDDLAGYRVKRREPVRGFYRGYEILSMPPPSSGGVALLEMLHILEGYDLAKAGWGSAENLHRYVEAMRRAFADRARYLGDPDFNPDLPLARLLSPEYAAELRRGIRPHRASVSQPDRFDWPHESEETTHLSVVDKERSAVSLTYTLENAFGSAIVVPGAGFLLNNEMGDFNAAPGLTTKSGLIGTRPNLTAPGKRMLSSMTPTIVARDGKLVMVVGSPGGRTIINTVLQIVLNVIDFQMNAQEAVDAGRIHHQWLPDLIQYERQQFSPDTVRLLESWGHAITERGRQGAAQVIVIDPANSDLTGGADRRVADSAAVGY